MDEGTTAGVQSWSSVLEFSAGVGSGWFGPVCWLTSSLHSSEFISSSHDTSTFHSQPDVSWENSAAQPVSGAVSGAKQRSFWKEIKYHHVFVQEWTDINNSVTSSTTAADKRTIRQLTNFCAIFIGVDSKQYSTKTNIQYFNIICIHVLLCMWRNTKKKAFKYLELWLHVKVLIQSLCTQHAFKYKNRLLIMFIYTFFFFINISIQMYF